MDWQADSIQGVIFTAPGEAQDDAISLWSTLFPGDSPDGFQKVTTSPTVVTHATGQRDGVALTLMSQLGRIDILAGPVGVSPQAMQRTPPRIEKVPAVARQIAEYLQRLVQVCRPIRAAVVLDLGVSVERGGQDAALIEVAGNVFPAGSTDPVFQFNVRRSFTTVPDLEMNRLCVITAGEMGFIMMGSPPPLGGGAIATTPYVGFKVDVNTGTEYRIPSGRASDVISELLDEALAIYDQKAARFIEL